MSLEKTASRFFLALGVLAILVGFFVLYVSFQEISYWMSMRGTTKSAFLFVAMFTGVSLIALSRTFRWMDRANRLKEDLDVIFGSGMREQEACDIPKKT